MMKQEFEQLARIEVSDKDYKEIIEPMYMATNLDKVEFISTLNLKRFALKTKQQLINQIKKLAKEYNKNAWHYTDWDTKEEIEKVLQEIRERFDTLACMQQYMKFSIFYYSSLLIGKETIFIKQKRR